MDYNEKIAFLRRYRDAQRTMRRCMEELAQLRAEAAEHDVKATLPYIRSILDRCQAQGIRTLAACQAAHRGGGGKRVDRPQPSGNDFLADAAQRPRRHKRKE